VAGVPLQWGRSSVLIDIVPATKGTISVPDPSRDGAFLFPDFSFAATRQIDRDDGA
jgi:hypothetical protein